MGRPKADDEREYDPGARAGEQAAGHLDDLAGLPGRLRTLLPRLHPLGRAHRALHALGACRELRGLLAGVEAVFAVEPSEGDAADVAAAGQASAWS